MSQPFRIEQAHRHPDTFFDSRLEKRLLHVRLRRIGRECSRLSDEIDSIRDLDRELDSLFEAPDET